MPNPDSAAAQNARASTPGQPAAVGVTEPYLRRQLEVRRAQIQTAMSEAPAGQTAEKAAPLTELLYEVDSAIQRMDTGAYGICEVCHDTIEKERLIADPLTTLCLDHLTGEEQRALERDLELAARIQRGLLPREDTAVGEWQIHFLYKPAGIVSGDYCDVIAGVGHGSGPFFLVGDVAGKGVAAALLMSHLHALFRSLSGIGLELGRLLEVANRVFCESTLAGQYATLICGRVTDFGQVAIASAGHLPALLVSKDGVQKIGSTGLPLGMFAASRYAVHRVNVEPGDSLLFFTDGLSETRSANGEEYGINGLSVAAANNRGLAPTELAAACFKDIGAFGSGTRQADDQTLMVVRRAIH
jgi:sigma-B regulation protein RsbU (phosphoserine phosphatase)